MKFDHEHLDVYKVSLEYTCFVARIVDGMKGYQRFARDQLIRASHSIPLNIAEGNAKRSVRDRRRFFEIARASAMECAATLDVLISFGACTEQEVEEGKRYLLRIVSMLSKLMGPYQPTVRETVGEYEQEPD